MHVQTRFLKQFHMGVVAFYFLATSPPLGPTFHSDVHASELYPSHYLPLHVSLAVYEDGGQVSVRVVRDACVRDALQELGGRKFGGQAREMLIQQCAEWNAVGAVTSSTHSVHLCICHKHKPGCIRMHFRF